MEFLKDRNRWSIVLVGCFVLVVASSVILVNQLDATKAGLDATTKVWMYSVLAAIFVVGILMFRVTWSARKEVMIYRENEREDHALNPHLLTVTPELRERGHLHASYRNGQPTGLTTVYSEDRTIRYVSPSVEAILGYKQIELMGEADVENVHPDHRVSFSHLFTRLKENPSEKIRIQYAYRSKEGNYIWLESVASNGLDDPEVNGFLMQTSDITARRLEEQANRMRSKIQALSENSPDLIIRLEEGTITYINPIIEYYTGKGPVAYLNKKAKDTDLHPAILESWSRIVGNVSDSGAKMILDIDFPSRVGSRIMQTHAIPEYDEKGILESVLLVSHDITDRKKIEMEVHHQNRKITESINYARRIQGAILPNARVVDRALPDSFILYKPRDTVSGDFPWFAQVKDEIFMAAVDCTGHGVPGALLSLVGYFLLNDIVRSRKITEPGRILDLLDESVSTTLRQDEDGTKDGMDISLCRINLMTGEVTYAGAHRPLYVVKNGVLQEIKGDKFPVGGGIFRNQTNFTSTTLRLNRGDSIYFCSDGFCDQFGGPKGRKFGTKQLRELISKVHSIPMKEAMSIFEDQWLTWKGDLKQTDDVLLIGIKF
jgi:PAS domain S-box-containing protein